MSPDSPPQATGPHGAALAVRARWIALGVLALTALLILGTSLVWGPVPWADGSAFYLPGLELIDWPPRWRMHAQAAFVPTYDEANFNLLPALPIVLALPARLGLLHLLEPQLLIRAISIIALLGWAWLLWSWLLEALGARMTRKQALVAASIVAAAGLWDPVNRWGTLVVRTETWIGLCWVWCLRELHRRELAADAPDGWNRAAWRISAGLALSAYFHFEAVYLVPAVVVGLGFSSGWFKRLIGVGLRTAALLSPWLVYVLLHWSLFWEQMQIQFYRLAHGNHWMQNGYMIFHSLFIEHGSPAGAPKVFNVGKGVFWLGILALSAVSLVVAGAAAQARLVGGAARVAERMAGPLAHPRRALLASLVAFASCFYLWATKAEVWFIALCHLVFWPWVGAALIRVSRMSTGLYASVEPARSRHARRAIVGLSGAYLGLSLLAAAGQARSTSPGYTWPVYQKWVSCIEQAVTRPGSLLPPERLRLWQPHVPDILVELTRRHPDWDMTRALDFPARLELAKDAGHGMDAIVFTRHFNPKGDAALAEYFGVLRPEDRDKLSRGVDLPFGPWALEELLDAEPDRWLVRACETGPFWAGVFLKVK